MPIIYSMWICRGRSQEIPCQLFNTWSFSTCPCMEALTSDIGWKDNLYKMTVIIFPPLVLASIFRLLWSGASFLSQRCTVESQQQQKCLSLFISLWISGNLWRRVFWWWYCSHLRVFSYFWDRPILSPLPVLQWNWSKGERNAGVGSAVRSPTLCSDVISVAITQADSIEEFSEDDLTFPF